MLRPMITLQATLLLLPTLAQAAPNTSIYTSLATNNCKTLESHVDEGGWYKGRCKGVAGYSLILSEGDLRQTLDVVSPNGKKSPLELWQVVSSGFSSLSNKAEWRIHTVAGKAKPIALIVRYNVNDNPEKPEQTTSYLVVSRIGANSSCVTDVVKPSANTNRQARQLADQAASKNCKQP